MKMKYLFPVLAGLAFSACSQDEDMLNTNVQKGDYSPITFSVSKEETNNPETRVWDMSGSSPKFTFAKGELLSLWNGMTWGEDAWTTIGQNAIFEGEGDGESVLFKTRSLVNQGTAIMVYPADTAFVNSGTTLKITVPETQDATTSQFRPYISDVMSIKAYSKDGGDNTAGYGRNYDILLRPVGTLFRMALKPTETIDFTELGVDPIEFTSVELKNNSTNIFVKTVGIKQATGASNLKTVDGEKYGHFDKMSDVVAVDSTASIKTTHIEEGNYAYFILLPKNDEEQTFDDGAEILIETTYGTVKVENDSEAEEEAGAGPLQNEAKNAGKNLAANLQHVMKAVWGVKSNSKFGEEKQGGLVGRTLTVDLSKLDMNNTVVKNSQQLIDVLKVYDALGIEGAITLKLDGETEDDANFVMTGAALEALKKYNADGTKITLDINELSGDAIELTDGATLEALNDESVKFSQQSSNTAILTEAAELDQSYTSTKIQKIVADAALTITNTDGSSTPATYELTANGNITFSGTKFNTGKLTTGKKSSMTVAAGQTVTMGGETKLYGTITNDGTMSASAGVTNYATVDNRFEISVLAGDAGHKFVNCGEIMNNDPLAVTFITQNQDDTPTNIGRIVLTNRNDNVSVKEATKKGYIVWTMTEKSGNGYVYSQQNGDVFNWLVVQTTGTAGDKVTLNNNVTYLTIVGNAVDVTADNITVTDLFVNSSMRLMGSNALNATNTYVADYILHAGGLKEGTLQTEYESKVYGEAKDTETYKDGAIRTVSGQ